ncbi:uncharacterized protein [Diadema setosum]|uniref:uncharacterized protein n=1 Tax=Diadema setosum TaxID=31175 RepID=UPI003B3AF72F
MADSKLIAAIGGELECPVCSEYFADARFLSCMHSFCLQCLAKCEKRYGRGGRKSMDCPLCRQETHLGKAGVASLKIDYTSNKLAARLLEIIDQRKTSAGSSGGNTMTCQSCHEDGAVTALCLSCNNFICAVCQSIHAKRMCTHEVVSLKDLHKGKVSIVRKKTTHTCSAHAENAEYFCHTCKCYVCGMCRQSGHILHSFSNIHHGSSAETSDTNKKRDEIKQAVRRLDTTLGEVDTKKRRVKRLRTSIKRRYGTLRDELKSKHDLRLAVITRTMKESFNEMLQQLNKDEETVLAKTVSIDEELGHTESRAREAKRVGDNALEDGQHAEVAFVRDYLTTIVATFGESNSLDLSLANTAKFSKEINVHFDEQTELESLVSLGHISYPEVWQVMSTCKLPGSPADVRSMHFDPATESFMVADTETVYSVDTSGNVTPAPWLSREHAQLQDMAVNSDGSTFYLLYNDSRIIVYEKGDPLWHKRTMNVPGNPFQFDYLISCLALKGDGQVWVGDQFSGTVSELSVPPVVVVNDISPLQMVFANEGEHLVVVCRSIGNVDDNGADAWNRAGVVVKILDTSDDKNEHAIRQNNWQAAAVATKHDTSGQFFALGIYVLEDGKQLASLAVYDRFGEEKEVVFTDFDLPVDLNTGGRPLVAAATSNTKVAICTGNTVILLQKASFHDGNNMSPSGAPEQSDATE